MKWLAGCTTLPDAKQRYKELLQAYHPDHAGPEGEAATREIIHEWRDYLARAQDDDFIQAKTNREQERTMADFDEDEIKAGVWRPFVYLGSTIYASKRTCRRRARVTR